MSFQTQQVKLPKLPDNSYLNHHTNSQTQKHPKKTRSNTFHALQFQQNQQVDSPRSGQNSNVKPQFGHQSMIHQQPFKLPSDNEVFDYCEQQKYQKIENKKELEKQQIWNKFTQITQRPLKQFKNFENSVEINEKHITKTQYRSLDKRNIQAALDIIKERETHKEQQVKKEPVTQVLEQKKEMFLVTMAHGIIEKEIQKLKDISEDKNKALQQSKIMLEQDQQNFTKYMELNQKQLKEADEKADKMAKLKREKENIIKQLTIQLTQIKNDKMRNEEMLSQFQENKIFLENMATREWTDKQEEERENFKNKIKEKWAKQQLQQQQDEVPHKKISSIKDTKALLTNKKQFIATVELEKKFHQMVENGDFPEITEFIDNQDMYFNDPDQLTTYFNTLEEQNLNLIQNVQEETQRFQELKNKYKEETKRLNEKYRVLQVARDRLRKQIDETQEQIKALQKRETKNVIKEEASDLNKIIKEMYLLFVGDASSINKNPNSNERESEENSKDLLTQVEICLENQIKTIKELIESNPKLVREQQKRAEAERKSQSMKEQIKRIQEEQALKDRKNEEKMKKHNKKTNGRIAMVRSEPVQQQEKIVEKIVNNDLEEDKKYFDPDFELTCLKNE